MASPRAFFIRALPAVAFFLLFILPATARAVSPISGFNPATLAERPDGVFLEGTSLWANDAFSVKSIFFDGFEGPFDPEDSNRVDVYWNAASGVVFKGWRLAAIYRGELFMDANRDTVEVIHAISNSEELTPGRTYDIDLTAEGFSATGVELSKGVDLGFLLTGLKAGVTARYLSGGMIQKGDITGRVVATGPTDYEFDLFMDYLYHQNVLYDRNDEALEGGEGYSFDIGLKYAFTENLFAEVLVRDLFGEIRWRNVPFTLADAASETESFDEQGYRVYRPTIRGFEGHKDVVQEIPVKTDLKVSYTWGSLTISPTVNLIETTPLWWLDIAWRAAGEVLLNSGYNFNYSAWYLGMAYKRTRLNFYLSEPDINRAKAVGINLSAAYEW